MAYLSRYELSSPQAFAVLAALDCLNESQIAPLLPETRENLTAAYHRLRAERCRELYRRPN